jgi:hypothetical protein
LTFNERYLARSPSPRICLIQFARVASLATATMPNKVSRTASPHGKTAAEPVRGGVGMTQ